MDIKSYLPCKKPRRSNRLEEKEKEGMKEKSVKRAPLGYFDVLPLELKFQLLRYLTIEDLSLLTITSKPMRNLIEGFCVLRPILKREMIDRLHVQSPYLPLPATKQTDFVNIFSRLGLLVKRSTCLYATKDRLKFINEVLTKGIYAMYDYSQLMCCNHHESCEDLSKCVAMTCFGKFLHTVIAGWDDCECVRTYDAVCHHTSILKNVKLAVSVKPGGHQRLEFEIRCFFRRVFLDNCSSLQDRAFWLTRILKPWPLVHQARILFMLYGPILQEEILWYELCENTPSSPEQSTQHFGELANALQILHHYKQEWTEDDVVSIIDEITSLLFNRGSVQCVTTDCFPSLTVHQEPCVSQCVGSPDEWLAENVAHLLILCGDVITSKMLISKAINGRMLELSSITTSFCVVCVKNSFSLNYVITMIQHVLSVMDNSKDRQHYFNSIMDMFKELIIDIHEFDEEESNDMYFIVTSLVEFTKKIIHMAFKDTLT